jgi:hypothetical protein
MLASADLLVPDQGEVAFGAIGLLMVLILVGLLVAAIAFLVYKVLATRELAKRNGASDKDATTIALFGGDVGTAAAYLRPGMPGSNGGPTVTSAAPTRSVEERAREVRALEQQGLISTEQANARIDEILREV